MVDGDEQSKGLRRSSSSRSANAEARMKFASVDALSELVWSPRNGQTNNMEVHSKSTAIEEEEEDEDNEVKSNEMNRPLSGVGDSVEDLKPEREEEMVEDKVETNDDVESEEAGRGVGSSKRSLDSPRDIGGKAEALLANEQLRLESAGSQEATGENNLETVAVAASKDLVVFESKEECLAEDETDVEKAGPSGSYRRRAKELKGKEKALSDGNFDDADDDDESFGSVESCNSAGLLLRGKKRPGFEQQLILGSKRLKTLSQECLGSTSKLKQDSSFMNWISNMTKGIWKGNEEEDNSPFVALTTTSDANGQVNAIVDQQQLSLKENSGCRNTGFQSFFHSIYCPKKRSQDAVEMDSTDDAKVASLQELCLITKGDHLSSSGNEIGPVTEHNISSEKVGFNKTSETFSSEKKHEDKEPNISLLSLSKSKTNGELKACGEADEKVTQCLTNRNSGLESLWISRFSSKSSSPQKKNLHERITNEVAKVANDSATEAAKTRDSQRMLIDNNPNTILPIVSSLRIESSEAMASLFARRLEAMKHIMPSSSLAENEEEGQANLVCFYCGKKGHRLQDCLEVTDTELRDLVQNISSHNGREEGSSLCIRCFQLSHWAATCPNAPPYSSGAEDRAMKHALASTSGTKLPLSGFTDAPKAVFDAVQVLRLTRTDVLKWINTKKSVSGLEGFFLRLRLGKWEEGLGGTGYYVARIDGATEGQNSRKHSENSSISVKVGGMTCFVESQFISNHDFLEEELKAWWRSAEKIARRSGDGGDGIPSAEELSRKIQQRKMLGF
ncbi:uncharacterized protein LOC18020512 isoform X2 [Eutrema salsugineum]|uniref:uncharacterized protein LOC18020512 isoform X2 n=1 Tax=Eutrema salsugineum TaxID=72664 RepID=UPI000CECE684|nr:uncharacterized protein LOC18020512 isoform X2 [Eutrema salsugineum]XP_024013243.1 uncharacterized protein LOC18020512 isoform X2 [Eutrema salsugineum]